MYLEGQCQTNPKFLGLTLMLFIEHGKNKNIFSRLKISSKKSQVKHVHIFLHMYIYFERLSMNYS